MVKNMLDTILRNNLSLNHVNSIKLDSIKRKLTATLVRSFKCIHFKDIDL